LRVESTNGATTGDMKSIQAAIEKLQAQMAAMAESTNKTNKNLDGWFNGQYRPSVNATT
jgi:hypothetical protein